MIRSTEIEDIRAYVHIGFNQMRDAEKQLLVTKPCYNSRLCAQLVFRNYEGVRNDYQTWSLLQNDQHLIKEYDPRNYKKNMMIDTDQYETVLEDSHENVRIAMDIVREGFRTFIKYHPDKGYGAGIGQHLDCSFKVVGQNGKKGNGDFLLAYNEGS